LVTSIWSMAKVSRLREPELRTPSMKIEFSDVEAADDALDAEFHQRPVVAGDALPARLPAVHPLAVVIENALLPHSRGWLEQAVGVGEPVIGHRDDFGAEAGVGQVDELLERYGLRFHSSCLPWIEWLGMVV